MSCTINLFDQVIIGESIGGTVEFLFYDSDQDGDADSGGTPIDVDPDGNVNFDLAVPGDYYFRHFGGVEPCNGELIFFVRVVDGADAGMGMTIDLCNDADPVNVFSLISGTPDLNGDWSGSGVLSSGWISDPDPTLSEFDPSLVGIGIYEFVYTVTVQPPPGFTLSDCPNCLPISTTVTINVIFCEEPPGMCVSPGISTSISICSSAGCTFDLIDQLGGVPGAGGEWSWDSGPAVIIPTNGDQGTVNFSGAPIGVYQFVYDPDDDASCPNSVVTVQVVAQPWAGTDGTRALCESNGSTNLFNNLGGAPNSGGTWTISPGLPNGTFSNTGFINPAPGDAGVYVATYTVSNPVSGPCGNVCIDTATVTVTITANCVANNGSAVRCLQGGTITLNASTLMPGSTNGGTWGVAGRSATCNNTYGPPAIFSVNGNPAVNHFGESLASGSVLTNFASLGCYLFIYTCSTPNPLCNDQSEFVLQIIDCPSGCDSEIEIQATACALSIVPTFPTNCPNPIYQWQVFQSGTWVAAPGDNDNTTYLGLHGMQYRLRVTGCPDCNAIYSDPITVSCPPPPSCTITCNLVYNTSLQRLEATIINSGSGSCSVPYQFNKANTNNASCVLCTGWGASPPGCSSNVVVPSMGSVTVYCNVDQTGSEQCFRFVTLSSCCNQTTCCVKIPPLAAFCWELPSLVPFTDITQIIVNAGSGDVNIMAAGNFNCTEYESTQPNGNMNGTINCSLAQAVIDINQWLVANGHSGTALVIQKSKSSSIRVINTDITFVRIQSVAGGSIPFAASGCSGCDSTSWHFQGLGTVENFPTTVGVGGYLNPSVPGILNLFTLLDAYFGNAPIELPHTGTFTAAVCTTITTGCVDINTNCWSDCVQPPATPVTVVNNVGFSDHGDLEWIAFTPINVLCHWNVRYSVTLPNGCTECIILVIGFNDGI